VGRKNRKKEIRDPNSPKNWGKMLNPRGKGEKVPRFLKTL